MGKTTGFLEFTRELPAKRSIAERLKNFREFEERYTDEKLNQQAARFPQRSFSGFVGRRLIIVQMDHYRFCGGTKLGYCQ